jgi:protein gp37
VIFVNSMSDLFHEGIPFEYVERAFEVIVAAPQHTFQILTKRHERLSELAPGLAVARQRMDRCVDREPPLRAAR